MNTNRVFPRVETHSGISCTTGGDFRPSTAWELALILPLFAVLGTQTVAGDLSGNLAGTQLIAQTGSGDSSTPPGLGLFDRLLRERRGTESDENSETRAKTTKGRNSEKVVARKKPVSKKVEPTLSERFGATSTSSPTLQPGLIVRISVFAGDQKEVDAPEKRVSSSGTLTLPLIGTVKVNSMTISQVSQLLQKRYSQYLRAPVVDVELVLGENGEELFPWGYVTILGRVKNPGRVRIPPTQDLSLSMGVQLAGGFDTSAKYTEIQVTRQMDENERRTLEVDLKEVGSDGNGAEDILLQPGDIVYIPERIL